MKKLRIFLPIFLISILFIPSINASTLLNNTLTIEYGDNVIENLENYSERLNNLKTYLENQNPFTQGGYIFDLDSGNYILRIQNMNTDTWKVWLLDNGSNAGNYFQSTYNPYSKNIQYYVIGYISFDINFSGNNVTSRGTNTIGNTFINWNVPSDCDITTTDCVVKSTGSYYDTTFYTANALIPFRNCTGTGCTEFGFKTGDNVYVPGQNVDIKTMFDNLMPYRLPSYSYTTEILDNGSVKINFNFQNYTNEDGYAYEIYNFVNGEYYGITNPYGDYPNIIPYQEQYSITSSFDTTFYIRLYKYENGGRDFIEENVIDINNVIFENPEDPYFKILEQKENNIKGVFLNTKSGYSCYYSNSNNNIIGAIICDEEEVNETFNFNGYVDFYIQNQAGHTIYSRKVNVLGADNTPYIIYRIEKQDFYSIINWEVKNKNQDPNMKYRYSTDNGLNYSQWETIGNEYPTINVYSNSTIIIQISNSDNTTIYDSKAIKVIENLQTIKTFNKSSSNLINIFNNMFNVNSNILTKINTLWNSVKSTKAYLIIFVPFISTLIGGIIYLIRRK